MDSVAEFLVATPVGNARCRVDARGRLTELRLVEESPGAENDDTRWPDTEARVRKAIADWFAGTDDVDIELAPVGTEFRQEVWRCLRAIPRGSTTTYGQLALEMGKPGAARAVGAACGANPIHLLVPCHRVVGGSGLTGYAAGIGRKAWLLRHEGALETGLFDLT